MTTASSPVAATLASPLAPLLRRASLRASGALAALACALLAACGGADAPPPPENGPVVVPPSAVAPTITQQPASLSVTVGQPASFSVAASGTAPITYQWQRNGTAISGATSTTYTIATTALSDSTAVFSAVATNVAGSATSNNATLTVTAAVPVLTISPQPANASVVAGSQASFTVGGTCSSGTLDIQWQRNSGTEGAFATIAGATSATYAFTAGTSDNGAQFRALLDCSGQSAAPSSVATLTVTAPAGASMAQLQVNGLRDQADVHSPSAIFQEPAGSYVFITGNRVKRLSADLSTIAPLAGNDGAGSLDGPAASATFSAPVGITEDAAGSIYVADTGNHTIRKIASDGTVSTIAGSAGATGTTDGSGSAARFNAPSGLATGPDGDLYVADKSNSLIRRVTTAGVVTTYAGSAGGFYADGPANTAKFQAPVAVAIAANGDVYVSDLANQRVRRIARSGSAAGNVSTIAGDGTAGTADGTGTAAQIPFPGPMILSGNLLWVCDGANRIRQIDLTTTVVTSIAGTLSAPYYADGPIGKGNFLSLAGIASGAAGGFVVTDQYAVRTVSAGGTIVTLASSFASVVGSAGVGTLPQIPFVLGPNPAGLLVEPGQSIVVTDPGTFLVRRIAANGNTSLIAGLTVNGTRVVDGQASGAQFSNYVGPVARDASGTLYVTDEYGVRRIATDGTVTFIAGSPTSNGISDGSATTARFFNPRGIAVASTGDILVSDNTTIRRVDTAGNVTTIAGSFNAPGAVDGPAASARFNSPGRLAFGPDGTLYIADGQAVRTLSPDRTQVATVTGVTLSASSANIDVDASGTLYYYGIGPDSAVGLRMRTAAGVDSLIVPQGTLTTGSSPALPIPLALSVYATKQVIVAAGNSVGFYIVTVP